MNGVEIERFLWFVRSINGYFILFVLLFLHLLTCSCSIYLTLSYSCTCLIYLVTLVFLYCKIIRIIKKELRACFFAVYKETIKNFSLVNNLQKDQMI